LEIIPDRINITDHMYLEGGLNENATTKKADHLSLSFDASLQDDRHPNMNNNTANFSESEHTDKYQMEIYLSEYILQSVV